MVDNTFSLAHAQQLDAIDPLAAYRHEFYIPIGPNGIPVVYLCGNSLGLQPKNVETYLQEELADWRRLGVEGHVHGRRPWVAYHEYVAQSLARLAGANPSEVVAMNSLTVNLHLLMVSFYRPSQLRYKVLIEKGAFPSDRYAVISQIEWHGYNPHTALVEVAPRGYSPALTTDDVLQAINDNGEQLALILLGGVNYYTGQVFDMAAITQAGHQVGAKVGFDLAHAIGNIPLSLHDWQVDFAAWCSYKYLNAGPGAMAGAFIHDQYAQRPDMHRFKGWWGHDKATRFAMPPDFQYMPGAEGWQVSNPSIFAMAPLRASLDLFDAAGLEALHLKSRQQVQWLLGLLHQLHLPNVHILTPPDATGCQLSLYFETNGQAVFQYLIQQGVIADWREPNVIRIAPVPFYNSFEDLYRFADTLSAFYLQPAKK
jgi:kynureninase